jgi:hypothetical protein
MQSRQQIGRQACTLRSMQQRKELRGTQQTGAHKIEGGGVQSRQQACTLRSTQQRKELRSTQ